MAKTRRKRLRATWLSVHKWIGLCLALLIIPISLSGSALVWSDAVEARLHPDRHAAIGPATLAPSAYAQAASRHLGASDALVSLRFDPGGGPVIATASAATKDGGRPARTTLWLDPRNGRLIDRSSGGEGFLQVMHILHGSLMVPGWGRTIVGWVGVAMFLSSLTGLWLWWPLAGGWRTGFQWKRRNTLNANLHYATGFWVLIPLAMLSFTGAWISFPKLFGQFDRRPPASAGPARETAARARPLRITATSVDAAVAAARPLASGKLTSIAWPTDQKPAWKVGLSGESGKRREIGVDDAAAEALPPAPPPPETLARTMRRWHDGTGMGLGWQVAIFLGGIIPALLSITGILIWWRARGPRQRARDARRLA